MKKKNNYKNKQKSIKKSNSSNLPKNKVSWLSKFFLIILISIFLCPFLFGLFKFIEYIIISSK